MASRLLTALGQALAYVAPHAFRVLAVMTDEDSATFATWPTITAGSAAPTEAQPNGSIYFRTNGTIYVMIASTWTAVAGASAAALAALGALTPAADRVPYFTSASAAALATFTATGRAIVAAADYPAIRTLLGLGTADSPTFAGVTAPLTGNASTATKLAAASYYSGPEQTGTGSEQIFAHTLGSTPSLVWVSLSEAGAGLASGFDVAYGVQSSTELRVTVTTGIKFYLFALK